MAWYLNATRAYGVKVVNPGGVERWKQGQGNVAALDDTVDHFGVTPRQILTALATAVDELGLPHPMHLHGLNLGLPGNAATTLETLQALDGHRAHLAHIQFHSYGGTIGDTSSVRRRDVARLADYVNTHANLTVDVGQVLFGETTSMTADGPVGQFLHSVTGRKWVSHDVELETGCGVVPITYEDKNFVHALQWAIGLEWYPARGRPLADRAQHRPPQRRLVPGLSPDHRAVDGPGPPRRPAQAAARAGPGTVAAGRADAANTRLAEIAIITRAAPGADARPDARRGISAPVPTATSRSTLPTTTRSGCSRCPGT